MLGSEAGIFNPYHFMPVRGTLDGLYEMDSTPAKKYYSIAGMTFAMNNGTDTQKPLKYLLTDHRDLYLVFFQVSTPLGARFCGWYN